MKSQVRTALLLFSPSLLPSAVVAQEPTNYCHEPEAISQWQQLLANSPKEPIEDWHYWVRQGYEF